MTALRSVCLALLALTLAAGSCPAQLRIGTGRAAELYEQNCANCHGDHAEGGMGGSLLDDTWRIGGDDASIARVIREGLVDLGMPAYSNTLSDADVRSLVVFTREKRLQAAQGEVLKRTQPRDGVFESALHRFRMETLLEGDGVFWSLAFLPDGSYLLARREGGLHHVRDGQLGEPIAGTPPVWVFGQGGLMQVALHPGYEKNGWVYLGIAEQRGTENNKPAGMTAVVRGRLRDGRWVDEEDIFRAPAKFHRSAGVHFGTKFVLHDGFLFFSIGERGTQDHAQDLTRPNGKIHRLHDDGRVPQDNPFVGTADAIESIWSYGHRNPQGLVRHPVTGALWSTEHGPRGGDELNLIRKGANYGWPVITYGMNYDGRPITGQTHAAGMEQPVVHWTPSIAASGLAVCVGDRFPRWRNDLLAGGLASEELHRLRVKDGQVVDQEIVVKNQGRIRDVVCGPDGLVYLALNFREGRGAEKSRLVRLVPE
jgi:glucose/arabinose dehydrogenase